MTNTRACPICGAPVPATPAESVLSGLCPKCILRRHMESRPEFVATGARARVASPPELSDIQRDFPQLEILELLGRGGMGLVYRARQRKLGRVVALKILAPELASDPTFAERFLREAQALAKLQHPNVVTVYDFGERHQRYFLLMEFVSGTPLRTLLDRKELDAEQALRLAAEICTGLQYAHERGIVHRDIKPENILVDESGRVKIADFGIARLLDAEEGDYRLTRVSQVMGTPQYMAPEQMDRPAEVDHRADIYSVGVVLYEMLVGELPLGRFALPSELGQLDARLDEVVLKSLEREPERRYPRVEELRTRLEELAAMPSPRSDAARGVEPAARSAGTSRWRAGLKVPFKNEDRWDGIYEQVGMVGLEGTDLVLEYREQDCLHIKKSELRTLRLSPNDISSVRLEFVWYGDCTLYITANRLDCFPQFPQVEPGCIRLRFTKNTEAQGELLSNCVQELLEAIHE